MTSVSAEAWPLSWGVPTSPQGASVIDFDELKGHEGELFGAPDRFALATPLQRLWERWQGASALHVAGVRLQVPLDLQLLYGAILEPAFRAGIAVSVDCDDHPDELDDAQLVDEAVGYPWTLQRLRWLLRAERPAAAHGTGRHLMRLDSSQRQAATAQSGVVQIIAPAGSGKTTVLVSRVQELLDRGAEPSSVLCLTFNRDARLEMDRRLRAAGIWQVGAHTYHSLGLSLLREAGLLRGGGQRIGQPSLAQWRMLAMRAQQAAGGDGVYIAPFDAQAAISHFKLGAMIGADEALRALPADAEALERTTAHLYVAYEQWLVADERHDFDDMILLTLRAMRQRPDLRELWQERFAHLLVDEFQDTEPAQEQIVRILAAPQDSLFCVGDEDQTLYGWRRASVERSLELHRSYPGVQRIALQTNYRCPREVVEVSRRVIARNRKRFAKPIFAPHGKAPDPEAVMHLSYGELSEGADLVARRLARSTRGDIVVLTRTTRMLRLLAEACLPYGVRLDAPEAIFTPRGAREAAEAYLRLLAHPSRATAEDVLSVVRAPNRSLPMGGEALVAEALADGMGFREAFAQVTGAAQRAVERLADAGRLLDELKVSADAGQALSRLRSDGGLDKHFREYEQTFGATETVELETLELLCRQGAGRTLADFADELTDRTEALRALRDPDEGIEITTVHRAKGREWPIAVIFCCEEDEMPHRASIEEDRAAGGWDGLEGERRVAYVAFTRAKDKLVLVTTAGRESRFLADAGVVDKAGRGGPGAGRLTPRKDFLNPAGLRADRAWSMIGLLDASDLLSQCASMTDSLALAARLLRQFGDDEPRQCVGALCVADLLEAMRGAGKQTVERLRAALPADVMAAKRVRSLSEAQRLAVAELLERAAAEPRDQRA